MRCDASATRLYGVAMLVVAGAVRRALPCLLQPGVPAGVEGVAAHLPRRACSCCPGSDVKVRGLIIGDVSSITSDGNGADHPPAARPGPRREQLPDNVTARLLPKTIFGEKYVDLVLPATPSGRHLADGDVIPEDRSQAALEINQALDDLLPMLRSVQPAKLNATLTALATALTGTRRAGRPHARAARRLLPRSSTRTCRRCSTTSQALVGVATTYDEAAGSLLRRARATSPSPRNTVVDRQQQIKAFLDDVTGAVDDTRDLLARNEQNIIAVNKINRPVRRAAGALRAGVPLLLPRLRQAHPAHPRRAAGQAAGHHVPNHAAHVVIEFVPSFPAYQYPIDLPEFTDTRGPNCYGLPNPPQSLPVIRYKDGTEDDPRFGPPAGRAVGADARRPADVQPVDGQRRHERGARRRSTRCSARCSASRRPTCPTSPTCCSARWPAAAR